MSGASNTGPVPRKAVLFGLDPSLASSLETELAKCGYQTEWADGSQLEEEPPQADIVFCPSARPMLQRVMSLFPHTPVVVVSRLPEVDGWLDALEDGAADYCAPPFETVQIRWLLEAHAGQRRSMAAA